MMGNQHNQSLRSRLKQMSCFLESKVQENAHLQSQLSEAELQNSQQQLLINNLRSQKQYSPLRESTDEHTDEVESQLLQLNAKLAIEKHAAQALEMELFEAMEYIENIYTIKDTDSDLKTRLLRISSMHYDIQENANTLALKCDKLSNENIKLNNDATKLRNELLNANEALTSIKTRLSLVKDAHRIFNNHWVSDDICKGKCMMVSSSGEICDKKFNLWNRKHHCRSCGQIFCQEHSSKQVKLDIFTHEPSADGLMARVCDGSKTAVGKRILKKKEPQVHEQVKNALFMKTTTTSEIVSQALKDLYALKKPDAVLFSRRNEVRPFEDPRSLEFFSTKNEASFIVLASHSKKRPHNLVVARMYDYQLLDMIEMGIEGMMMLDAFTNVKAATGKRPLLVFQGDCFESIPELTIFKSIMMDFFRGDINAEMIDLNGIEHVITFTGIETKKMRKSETNLPRIELEEMGPRMDFGIKRFRQADSDSMKQATKIPKELRPRKVKNIEHDAVGDQYGRIHMEKQDLNKLQTRKMKGLKKPRKENDDAASEELSNASDDMAEMSE